MELLPSGFPGKSPFCKPTYTNFPVGSVAIESGLEGAWFGLIVGMYGKGECGTSVSAPLAGSIAYMAMLAGPATNRNFPCPSTAMGAALCAGKGLEGIAAREPERAFLSNPEMTAALGLFVPVPVAYTCCCGVWQRP